MQTWGSRGDVVPFIALAAGLQAAGHDVKLAVTSSDNRDYSELATRVGIDLEHVHGSFQAPPEGLGKRIVRTPDRLEEASLLDAYYLDPAIEDMFAAGQALCAESDIVIGHFWLHTLLTAATLQRVPRVVVHFCPIGVRSRHMPAMGPHLGTWLNGLVWDLGDRAMRRKLFRKAAQLRADKGLPPIRSLQEQLFVSDDLTLIATSPSLCVHQPDWGSNIAITGYLPAPHPESSSRVPDAVRAFIEAGEPPLFLTFGSCEVFCAEENVKLFMDTLERLDERAIIQSSYVDAFGSYDQAKILPVGEIDHTQVFPRCKLVVHHGGAGTTQTSLNAGVPSIVVAHGFDQTYWGRALVGAGVSPQLLHRRSVTPARLASAIRKTLRTPTLAANARRMRASLAAEDGVRNAVEIIGRKFG